MALKYRITCLNNDTAGLWGGFWAEHGLSFYIETRDKKFLLDTGTSPEILEHNLKRAGKDLSDLDMLFLSHGHYDHTGALEWTLSQIKHPVVAADPQVFDPKFGLNSETGETKPNGSFLSKEEVQARAELRLSSEPFEAAEGVIFSGRIPHVTEFEKVPDYFVRKTESGLVHDPIRDDRSLILDHPRGLILVCGCCHSGLVNTMTYVRGLLQKPLYAVLGGIHLVGADSQRIEKTIAALRDEFKPEQMFFNHCTGEKAYLSLKNEFGDKVQSCHTGDVLEF